MIGQEELRLKLAKSLGISIDEIGGGLEYGQFWNGPNEYPYEEVRKRFGAKSDA